MATKKASTKKPVRKVSAAKAAPSKKPTVKKAPVATVSMPARASKTRSSSFSAALERATTRRSLAALIAELLGTFMLTGLVITVKNDPLYVFFGFIAIIVVMRQISGSHLNPAVSIASWLTRRMSFWRAFGYVIAQFFGAMLAYGLMGLLFNNFNNVGSDSLQQASLYHTAGLTDKKEWFTFGAELIGAFILGFGVSRALASRRDLVAAISYAGTLYVAFLVLAGTGISNLILNPAVALGIQAFDFTKGAGSGFVTIAVWFLATVIGATLGMALYRFLRVRDNEVNA